jgi:hypothetical protein
MGPVPSSLCSAIVTPARETQSIIVMESWVSQNSPLNERPLTVDSCEALSVREGRLAAAALRSAMGRTRNFGLDGLNGSKADISKIAERGSAYGCRRHPSERLRWALSRRSSNVRNGSLADVRPDSD